MTHRKDLIKQGYRHGLFGTKAKLQRAVFVEKKMGTVFKYRIVPYNKTYHELYIKK